MLLRGLLRKADLGLVFVIELGSEGWHLAALEVRDLDRSPALGGSGHGGEHELEDGLLAEGVGYDIEAPALFPARLGLHPRLCFCHNRNFDNVSPNRARNLTDFTPHRRF